MLPPNSFTIRKIILFTTNIFIDYLGISYHASWSHLLPCPPRSAPHPSELPKIRRKGKQPQKKNHTSSICVAYIITPRSMFKLPIASPLQKTESFPPATAPDALICGQLHFSILFTILKSSLPWFMSRLLLLVCVGRGWRVRITSIKAEAELLPWRESCLLLQKHTKQFCTYNMTEKMVYKYRRGTAWNWICSKTEDLQTVWSMFLHKSTNSPTGVP